MPQSVEVPKEPPQGSETPSKPADNDSDPPKPPGPDSRETVSSESKDEHDDAAAAASVPAPASAVGKDGDGKPTPNGVNGSDHPPESNDARDSPNGNPGANGITATVDVESELSDPGSSPNSPLDFANEIVVQDHAAAEKAGSPNDQDISDDEDEAMPDADPDARPRRTPPLARAGDAEDDEADHLPPGPAASSPYPRRKRAAAEMSREDDDPDPPPAAPTSDQPGPPRSTPRAGKPQRTSLAGGKGVVIGHWRESPVPDPDRRHAVIGFIDIRDRLRTRIQSYNLRGEQVSEIWPLAAKTGASWVTFEGIHFLPHLVGLDQLQVKEYVRIRSNVSEPTVEAREAAEAKAVQDAIRTVRESALADTSSSFTPQPLIAHGADLPDSTKRRRTSGGFHPSHGDSPAGDSAYRKHALDPLHGSRPTRILLGVWSKSEADSREDRHAVYGILGHNDMFRVKLVRETHYGEFKDGNFPQGAGALWIAYEEVDFDPHLKNLTRAEIKEYCRIRQYQIDHGEHADERIANELKAASDAQTRASMGGAQAARQPAAGHHAPSQAEASPTAEHTGRRASLGQELRSSRRVEAMAQAKNQQQQQQQQQQQRSPVQSTRQQSRLEQINGGLSYAEAEARAGGAHLNGALQRTNDLAEREIARAEAAQGRADLHATQRERAAAAAAHAATAAAAAAAASGPSNGLGDPQVHDSHNVRRLNDIWARQESMRARAGGEDAKIYDGIKYERKSTGPFLGKLVSHGTIISIDGEDYVEYRVLTKPSFF